MYIDSKEASIKVETEIMDIKMKFEVRFLKSYSRVEHQRKSMIKRLSK
jgi:hypothetical protein